MYCKILKCLLMQICVLMYAVCQRKIWSRLFSQLTFHFRRKEKNPCQFRNLIIDYIILEFRAQNEKLESQSVIASLNYQIEIHAMLFLLSNIYAFAQASVN